MNKMERAAAAVGSVHSKTKRRGKLTPSLQKPAMVPMPNGPATPAEKTGYGKKK